MNAKMHEDSPVVEGNQGGNESTVAEFWDPAETFGFPQRQLPWILAGFVFLLYLFTACKWLRLEALESVGLATGWDPLIRPEAPLYRIVGLLVSILPDSYEVVVHNILAALFGALTAYFLARIVALWPYDRTPDCRAKNQHPFALLVSKLGCIPPTIAVLLFATSRVPWFHGTVATGEMLDLFMAAWIVYHLALFRIYNYEDETTPNQGDKYLYRACMLTGLAITNNYAMIGWSACILLAIVWLKLWRFLDLSFLSRCGGAFLGGLLAYLLVPLYLTVSQKSPYGFWILLKHELALQKNQLLSYPRVLAIIILLYTLLPLLIAAIRWKRSRQNVTTGEMIVMPLLRRLLYLCMAVLALGQFYHRCVWSPGYLGAGTPWLPVYFLAAISFSVLVGSALVEMQPAATPHARRPEAVPPILTTICRGLLLCLLPVSLCMVGFLIAQNLPFIYAQRGLQLKALARAMLSSIEERTPYIISDDYSLLSIANISAKTHSKTLHPVILYSRLLANLDYHRQMRAYYGALWPYPFTNNVESGVLLPPATAAYVTSICATSAVYYLNPSFGYFFESVYLEPHGLVYKVRPTGTNFLAGLKWDQSVIHNNERFWNEQEGLLTAIAKSGKLNVPEGAYTRLIYSRALDWWGVALQRNHELVRAAKRFEQAIDLYPDNISAQINLELNHQLQKNSTPPLDPSKPIEDPRAQNLNWEQLLNSYGPVDQPRWSFGLAENYRINGQYRQALIEFTRISEFYPEDRTVQLYRRTTEALAWLSTGNITLAERLAQELRQAFPDSLLPLALLVDVYLASGQHEKVIEVSKQQLQLDPEFDTARLNISTALIRLDRMAEAIPYLDQILSRPSTKENADLQIKARFNRAICYLKLGQLEKAKSDYELLLKEKRLVVPTWAIYFGLGEIAYRTRELATAKKYYEEYLKIAPQTTEEYRRVEMRLQEIKEKLSS